MANDFDEASASDEFIRRKHEGQFKQYGHCLMFIEGARHQHSLMQERLASLNSEIAILQMENKAIDEQLHKAEKRLKAWDSFGIHDERDAALKHNAQLSATCERMRVALECANKELRDVLHNANKGQVHFDGDDFHECLAVVAEALESGERGGAE
jgi:TolA-binding protein